MSNITCPSTFSYSLIDVNQACLDLFGIEDKKDVFGCNLFDDPNLKDEYKERLRRKQSVRYEVAFDFAKVQEHNIYPTSRQGIIWLDVQITPIDERPCPDTPRKISEILG